MLSELWERHLHGNVPLQHLVGLCPWRDVLLESSPAALIPRQETELLVDLALSQFKATPPARWADLGTGSGAIAVALARAWPTAPGHGVDLSSDALHLAERNLERCAPHHNCSLHLGVVVVSPQELVGKPGFGGQQSSIHPPCCG